MPKNFNTEIKRVTPEVAQKLAAGFAAIMECRDYIPSEILEDIQAQLVFLIDSTDWCYKPELLLKVFPIIGPYITCNGKEAQDAKA